MYTLHMIAIRAAKDCVSVPLYQRLLTRNDLSFLTLALYNAELNRLIGENLPGIGAF